MGEMFGWLYTVFMIGAPAWLIGYVQGHLHQCDFNRERHAR